MKKIPMIMTVTVQVLKLLLSGSLLMLSNFQVVKPSSHPGPFSWAWGGFLNHWLKHFQGSVLYHTGKKQQKRYEKEKHGEDKKGKSNGTPQKISKQKKENCGFFLTRAFTKKKIHKPYRRFPYWDPLRQHRTLHHCYPNQRPSCSSLVPGHDPVPPHGNNVRGSGMHNLTVGLT